MDEIRATLGTIGVAAGRYEPEAEFRVPARGKKGGAGRGAAIGAAIGAGIVASLGEGCVGMGCGVFALALPPAAFLGAVAGGINGMAKAEDAAVVDAARVQLDRAASEAKTQAQVEIRDRVFRGASAKTDRNFVLLTEQGPLTADAKPSYQALVGQDIDTVLELRVMTLGLAGEWAVNPRTAPEVSVQIRLVRVRDDEEIYANTFGCCAAQGGRQRKFPYWAREGAKPFRGELKTVYRRLARDIVWEMFLE